MIRVRMKTGILSPNGTVPHEVSFGRLWLMYGLDIAVSQSSFGKKSAFTLLQINVDVDNPPFTAGFRVNKGDSELPG